VTLTIPAERTGPQAQALELLAEEVRQHHKAVERHANAMVAAAVVAGEKLIEAKELLRHGEFGPFRAYCGVSARSARVYMRLARNSADAAVLEADSIRAALDALATPSRKRPKELNLGSPFPPKSRDWQLARWFAAMEAQGRDIPQLHRHFRRHGIERAAVSEEVAKRWTGGFLCQFCRRWHRAGRRIGGASLTAPQVETLGEQGVS
jgi:hypothetical protein